MAAKTFAVETIGDITVIKRQGNRHLRLSISPNGEIRVTIPKWAPYQSGLDFARAKRNWIDAKRPTPKLLTDGQFIGKAHRINFIHDASSIRVSSRIRDNRIDIICPFDLPFSDISVQLIAQRAVVRALRAQATALLPKRIEELSQLHQISFNQLLIKQMSRRWGSCDQKRCITLNLFLIQLPWQLIDYVILHEMAHLKNLNHSAEFWQTLEQLNPGAKQLKKQLNNYHPGII